MVQTDQYEIGPQKGTGIKIREIGPVINTNIELSSVTLLLGRPNTGKSYILKTIYGILGVLNESESSNIARDLKKQLTILLPLVDESPTREIAEGLLYGIIYQFSKLMADRRLLQSAVMKRVLRSPRIKGLINELGRVTESVGSPEITHLRIELSRTKYIEAIVSSIFDNLRALVPFDERPTVEINDESIDNILSRRRVDTFLTLEDHDVQVRIPLSGLLLPLFEERNSSLLRHLFPFWSLLDLELPVQGSFFVRIVNEEKLLIDLSLQIQEFSISESSVSTPRIDRYMGEIFESVEPDDLVKALNELIESLKKRSNISQIMMPETLNKINSQVSSAIVEGVASRIADDSVKEVKRTLVGVTGIKSVKFIPYGRSLSVSLFSGIKDTLIESPWKMDLIRDIKGSPYFEYFKLLESGLKIMEETKDLQELFIPVLGGHLRTRKISGDIVFEFRKGKSVPIEFSSAMVEEVMGIMAPLMTVEENELILIEEPEAQLHYSSQIIITLIIIALSKLKKSQFIITTHSDIVSLTVSAIASGSPPSRLVARLVKNLNTDNYVPQRNINKLSDEVTSEKFPFKANYYSLKNGISQEVKEEDLNKSVPGVTSVFTTLLKWKLSVDENKEESRKGDKS